MEIRKIRNILSAMTEIGFKIKDYASMNTAAMWTQMNIFQNKDRLPAINPTIII
jgi:hypothetical protein